MGEALPHVKIAKKYIEKGGKVVFFSHGGKFEYLAQELGCQFIKLKDLAWKEAMSGVDRLKTREEDQQLIVYNKKTIDAFVEDQIDAFKKTDIDILVSSFNPACSISTRVLKIPLVTITSGTMTRAYFQQGYATFPENYENFLTRLLPISLKNRIAKWLLLNNKRLVKESNFVAKKYNIKRFVTMNDLIEGDYTFICDDINLLGVKPTEKIPAENFIGPISAGIAEQQDDNIDEDIKKHLGRPGKTILLIMGSFPDKTLFPKILEALNKTDYNIIAVYTSRGEILPELKDNILLKQFIKSPQIVHNKVDLAIIHGGRGTVYNAAFAGKPIIGMPTFIEQQHNIDCLVRNGIGIRISRKFFKQKELLGAINTIFNNYETYSKKAKELSNKLSKVPGEEQGAKRLSQIIEKEIKN